MGNRYIVMVGTAGAAAAIEIAAGNADVTEGRFPRFFLKQGETLENIQKKLSEGIPGADTAEFCVDLAGKSILMALWELGEVSGMGFEVIFADIPISQFTIEITELFGLNPYEEKTGEGRLLVLEEPERIVAECRELGLPVAVIGKTNETKARTAVTAEGVRYLNSK